MNRPTHCHYIVWAYERVEPDTGNYVDNTIVDVLADSELQALSRAKDLVAKKAYRVQMVIEHLDDQPCAK